MSHRIIAGVTVAAASAALLVGTAVGASANQFVGQTLVPGQQVCVQQFAGYQVRADGLKASGQGAKFKLEVNGVAVPGAGSPGLVSRWAAEYRTSFGTFPGPGYYTACATNNGTANTNVQLQLRTDNEI